MCSESFHTPSLFHICSLMLKGFKLLFSFLFYIVFPIMIKQKTTLKIYKNGMKHYSYSAHLAFSGLASRHDAWNWGSLELNGFFILWAAIKPRLVECCSDSWPSESIFNLHTMSGAQPEGPSILSSCQIKEEYWFSKHKNYGGCCALENPLNPWDVFLFYF